MLLKVLFNLFSFWSSVSSYKLLVALPTTFPSHYQFGSEISKVLASVGHEVTVISPFKQPKALPNYEEVYLELTQDAVRNVVQESSKENLSSKTLHTIMKMAIAIRDKIGASIKNSANFQQLLKSKKQFDVILVESLFCDELLGLGHHFNAPVISISPTYESSEMGSFTAMPALKSFMPSLHNIYTDKMNFWERLHNMLSYWGIHYILKALKRSETQINYEMMFQNTKNPPSLLELKRNVSLIITNSGWNLTPPRPLMPHMIDVGGIAIKSDEVEPLPNDLQAFLDKSQFGAVYFSLGTIVNFTDIEHMIILHVFSQLSNVRFLVKGNEELLNLSKDMPNVLVQSWFPQKAILRHPNLKCFISHGGHNSVQESIFYGKPVIAMPFYFDHFMNTRWAVEKGYGIELPFNEMTSKNLKSAIENVLFNQSYERQAQIASDRFHDRLVSPMQTLIFWVECVAETKGTPYLHSIAAHFPTYLYYNLDVWALYALAMLLALYILCKMVSFIVTFATFMNGQSKQKIS